ncbi:hypothetical protein PspLS_01726 [Pyricularia sp. CBS 133598]|nr:hypothetical protein PspLS_01726 [Pyricularia sp. CBS 133598]
MEDKSKDLLPNVQVIIEPPNASGTQAHDSIYHEDFYLDSLGPDQMSKADPTKMILQQESQSNFGSHADYILAR